MTYCMTLSRLLFGAMLCIGSQIAYSQPDLKPLDETNGALLQRIIQYESVLGFELKPKVALCVDEAMGSIWFLGDDPSLEVRQSIAYKLRNVAESCAVAMSSEKARLAAQLRALTERQLKLAQRLEMPVATARACVAKSATPTEFRNCISKVLRNPPDETDWGYWMVLYERKTPT
jgi:hypothetical protein